MQTNQDKTMKIAFDAKRIVRNGTGLGAYGRTLVNDLARQLGSDDELLLYAPDEGREPLRSQVKEGRQVHFVYPEGKPMGWQRSLWRTGSIVHDLQRDGVDIYHGLTGELPRGLRAAGIPGVVTIHDLIFLRHPEYYHWIDTKIYAWKFRVACREASRIIAISERTRQDIIELGGIEPDRINVIYQSCSPRFSEPLGSEVLQEVSRQYELPKRFILNVGSIEARKNVLLAVKALRLLPADVCLVVVGKHTSYTDKVEAYVRGHQLGRRVRILHGIDDHALQAFYQMAEAFVYPSRYEGFGIPIIEAVFSGLPVVACTGSCLEEAGGPDSLYVGLDDVEAMGTALRQVLKGAEGREERIRRSRDYVQRFVGGDVAAQVMKIYKEMI